MEHLKVNLAGMFYGLDVSLQNECCWGFLLMKLGWFLARLAKGHVSFCHG
jgi:hypothetical protein